MFLHKDSESGKKFDQKFWDQVPPGPEWAFLPFLPLFGAILGPYLGAHCTLCIQMFLWSSYSVLVCISNVSSFCLIHSGPLRALKGPGNEHICYFFHNFGHFRPKLRFFTYLMHSNLSLSYLPGTGYYFNSFWLLHDPYRVSRGFLRAQKQAFLPFPPLLGLFLAPYEGPHVSYLFKCFPEVPTR